MNIQTVSPAAATVDFEAIKGRQRQAWNSGDYALIGATLQIVGESLCEALDLRSTWKVLDVAAGNGNATLAAARRFADVTSTDYVPELLERGRQRAQADGLNVKFEQADVEALPYPDDSFDAVLSTFGVMFAPNQAQAAREMLRVAKKGGRIGLANWTPDGFIGRLFKTIGKYVPPAPGLKSPALWGDRVHLQALFGKGGTVEATARHFVFRYRSPAHWLDIFRTYYGPVLKAFAAIDPEARGKLEADLVALMDEFNVARDGTLVVPGEYLEVVVRKN